MDGIPIGNDNRPQISLVLPMYNEEENIRTAVAAAEEVLEPITGGNYEIIIVDDASTDRTGQIAEELAEEDHHIRPLHHATNRTLGGAIRTGLSHSQGEVVVYTDADLPCDINHIAQALPLLNEADVVIGYRISRQEGLKRWLYSKVYNLLIRLFLKLKVRDVNFAFKVFKHQVVEVMDLHSEGSFIDAEMLAEAQRHGFRIAEIPIKYQPRQAGESTLARPAVILKIFREMFQYWRRQAGH